MAAYIRPGFLISHVANPVLRRLGIVPILVVPGRRSGRPVAVPMGEPLDLAGRRYLVSGRGDTHWVRNLRAAGGGELRVRRRKLPFRAVELHGPEQERIVAAYRERLGHRVDAYFREIPEPTDHPVFRMDPVADASPATIRGIRS